MIKIVRSLSSIMDFFKIVQLFHAENDDGRPTVNRVPNKGYPPSIPHRAERGKNCAGSIDRKGGA